MTYTRKVHFFVVLKGISILTLRNNEMTEVEPNFKDTIVFIKFGDSMTPRILMEAYLVMLGSWAYIETWGKFPGF